MELIQIEKEQYNKFVSANATDGGLLQSWQWGEFKKNLGQKIWRLAIADQQENLLAVCLIIRKKRMLGLNYFYAPRGPIIKYDLLKNKDQVEQILNFLLDEIKNIAQKEKAIYLEVEPGWPETLGLEPVLQKTVLSKQSNFKQPLHTLLADLSLSEEDLLKSFHSKTRYNIRLAERKGVEVKTGVNNQLFEDFFRMIQKTQQRQNIRLHSKNYYQKMMDNFKQDYQITLFVSYFQGQPIASIMVLFFGNWAYYLHGGSDNNFRSLMAPHLLQWSAIKKAKENGCFYYDFWGVYGGHLKEKNWQGITRFKKGFAPTAGIIEFTGIWRQVYRQRLYNILSFLKK